MLKLSIAALALLLSIMTSVKAATITSVASGNWSSILPGWRNCSCWWWQCSNWCGYTVTVDANTASLASLVLTRQCASCYRYINSYRYTITVDGSFMNSSTVLLQEQWRLTVVQHSNTSTTIPSATWNTGSTCEITGWSSTATLTTSFNQTFYNFIWNCEDKLRMSHLMVM